MAGPILSNWPTQDEVNAIFVDLLFHIALFGHFFYPISLWLIYFCFQFCGVYTKPPSVCVSWFLFNFLRKEKERGHEIG